MPAFEKLQAMLDAAMKQAGEESSMLLGQSLTVGESDMLNTDRRSYFGDDEANPVYVVGVESREAYPGRFYLVFALADAIVMSSILLGIPGPRVAEKRRLCIQEPDDVDAFGEIANQVIGSFNSIFQPMLPDKVHLKLLAPVKHVPGMDELTDELPLPDAPYLMYRAPLEIQGQEMDRIDIMVPPELANLFDPQPEPSAEELAEAAASAEATGQAKEEKPLPSILVMGDVEGRENLVSELEPKGLRLIHAPLDADLQAVLAQGEVKLALVTLQRTADRDLSIFNRVVPLVGRSGGSVLVCAPQWTRVAVLKALKAGVKGILMPPLDHDELNAKVDQFLKAS
ncbi:response regulator [Geomonas silvestris]|uniref:Response regulator n=1 Tax=Geomonas silvestris TaxID=2740184 RepID=A0A6V8MF30_9BACT|nr:response regulator [Geomonas silvestris]GFO58601.1 response regulator [Geomonas silvestris]